MPQFFENGSNILNSLSLSQNAAILSKVFGNNVLNPGLNPTAFSSAFTGSQLTDLALYQALLNNNLVQQPQTIFPSQDNIALLTLLLRLINKNQTVEGYWPRSQHYPTSQSTSTPTTPVTPLTPLTPFLDGFFQKDTPSRKCSTEEYSSSYGSPTLKNSNLLFFSELLSSFCSVGGHTGAINEKISGNTYSPSPESPVNSLASAVPPGHLSPVNLHLPHVVTELADKQKPNKKNRKRRLESKVESNDPANGEAKFGYKKYKKKLKSDSITNSPVSGMFIKDYCNAQEIGKATELDDSAPYVHISTETRKAIEKIPNLIGEPICFLCKAHYDDVFKLAMHRCPRIGYVEHKCFECNKIFPCPANLASHLRWHRHRPQQNDPLNKISSTGYCKNNKLPTKKAKLSVVKIEDCSQRQFEVSDAVNALIALKSDFDKFEK